jgi:ionotropic glutamate receptor
VLAQDVLPTFQRNRIVDLTTYWYYGDLVFLIPVPDETANINSVVKPFQWKVLYLIIPMIFHGQQPPFFH